MRINIRPDRQFARTFIALSRGTQITLSITLLGLLVVVALSTWLWQRLPTPQPSEPPMTLPSLGTAQEFALPTLDGRTASLSDYGGKVVLVNFWASWCVPCQEEIPALKQAYKALEGQGFVILGVNRRDRENPGAKGDQDVRAFVESFAIDYPILIDKEGVVARAYGISAIPTSYLVDRDGQVRDVLVGMWLPGELEALVGKLNQETSR